jgi:hypothetical protein
MKNLDKKIKEIRRDVHRLIRKKDFLEAFSESEYEIPVKERAKMKLDAVLIEKYLKENLELIQQIL